MMELKKRAEAADVAKSQVCHFSNCLITACLSRDVQIELIEY